MAKITIQKNSKPKASPKLKSKTKLPAKKSRATKHVVTKKSSNEWNLSTDGKNISRTFVFKKHIEAIVFVARVAIHGEVLQLTPKIIIEHTEVTLALYNPTRIATVEQEYQKRASHAYERMVGE